MFFCLHPNGKNIRQRVDKMGWNTQYPPSVFQAKMRLWFSLDRRGSKVVCLVNQSTSIEARGHHYPFLSYGLWENDKGNRCLSGKVFNFDSQYDVSTSDR